MLDFRTKSSAIPLAEFSSIWTCWCNDHFSSCKAEIFARRALWSWLFGGLAMELFWFTTLGDEYHVLKLFAAICYNEPTFVEGWCPRKLDGTLGQEGLAMATVLSKPDFVGWRKNSHCGQNRYSKTSLKSCHCRHLSVTLKWFCLFGNKVVYIMTIFRYRTLLKYLWSVP